MPQQPQQTQHMHAYGGGGPCHSMPIQPAPASAQQTFMPHGQHHSIPQAAQWQNSNSISAQPVQAFSNGGPIHHAAMAQPMVYPMAVPQGGQHQAFAPTTGKFAEDLELDGDDDDSMDDADLVAAVKAAETAHASRSHAPAAAPSIPTQRYSLPRPQGQGFASAGHAGMVTQQARQYNPPARTGEPRHLCGQPCKSRLLGCLSVPILLHCTPGPAADHPPRASLQSGTHPVPLPSLQVSSRRH